MTDICEVVDTAAQPKQVDSLQQVKRLYKKYLESDPTNTAALHSLGSIAYQRRSYDLAIEIINKAIEVDPQQPQLHNIFGIVLNALERFEEAVDAFQRALSLRQDYVTAYNNMAVALQGLGRSEEAIETCCKAISIKPDYAEPYYTMAFVLQEQGRYRETIEHCAKAVSLRADYAEAYNMMASAEQMLGQYDNAMENYRQAISLKPDYAQAHNNLAMLLLLTGKFAQGWKEYNWRLKGEASIYPHRFEAPVWDGSSFVGKRLFVHYEQGFGDTLQFVRYLPMVKARGGMVSLEVQQPLYGLLRDFSGVDELVEASPGKKPAVEFDFHTSLMDLPGIFETTPDTMPADVPYLRADSAKSEYWRDKIACARLKVGIAWSGSATHGNDRYRSCRLEDFAALAAVDGVRLYGLQKGQAAAQAEQLSNRIQVTNLAEQFEDFTDTAAVIENLDLVISVDTSAAHLAGAMGKPVWILLPFAPDWRWMLGRGDSPWYPTVRLFRQSRLGQWDDVFQRAAEELLEFS